MYRKYFFKSKGVLSRKFVASGLSAVFSAGMFSSYAGAMEPEMDPNFMLFNEKNQKDETQIEPVFPEKLNEDKMQEKDKELLQGITKENIKNIKDFSNKEEEVVGAVERCLSQIEEWVCYIIESSSFWNRAVGRAVGSETALKSGKYDLLRLYAYSFYLGFKNGGSSSEGYENFYSYLVDLFEHQYTCAYEPFIKLDSDTKNKLLSEVEDKKNVKEENEKEENEKNDLKKVNKKISLLEKSGEEIEELLKEKKSTVKQKLGENIKNKTKNKLKKMIVVVPVIILLALIIKTLAVKGKSNTDNNNKDDEKVNPPINPETPLTDPESDEQNPEQKKQEQGSQEQKPSVVPNNILKVTGATVAAGGLAGGGSYLVNEVVLKRGKSSNVSPKNGDDKCVYLDYDGNEKEIENENNNDDSKDAITSDLSSKQSYEGKKEKGEVEVEIEKNVEFTDSKEDAKEKDES